MGIVLIKEKTVITDDVPSEFCLDYKSLISELKKKYLILNRIINFTK